MTILFTLVILFISIWYYAGPRTKKYIFIDGGAHNGESLLAFQKTGLYKKYPWKIFAIEANPYKIKNLKRMPGITVINKAIWNKNGTVEFILSKYDSTSSLYNNRTIKQPKTITVESFDFGQWLCRKFSVNDFIIISLDIEGAEYEVLDKMFADGTIKYVDRFYIEFHSSKLKQFQGRENELLSKLEKSGVLGGFDSVENMLDGSCNGWIDTIEK